MNEQTDKARWEGEVAATLKSMQKDIEENKRSLANVVKFLAGLILALAGLYLRSVGLIP